MFSEFFRAVRPDGPLLIAFHAGDEMRHADELLGVPVDLDFYLHPVALVTAGLAAAGLPVEATLERIPYAPHEVATQRAYVLARKPSP